MARFYLGTIIAILVASSPAIEAIFAYLLMMMGPIAVVQKRLTLPLADGFRLNQALRAVYICR